MNDEILTEAEPLAVTEETVTEDAVASPEDESSEATKEVPEAEEDTAPLTEDNQSDGPAVEQMLEELRTLREELLEKRKAFEKISRDIGEFEEIFPEKSVGEIPDAVWESVKAGIPLAAAYALYERKNALRASTAQSANKANSARTTGAIGRETTENFYTPDEVRAMSRAEVRKNYSKIIESMKKWN